MLLISSWFLTCWRKCLSTSTPLRRLSLPKAGWPFGRWQEHPPRIQPPWPPPPHLLTCKIQVEQINQEINHDRLFKLHVQRLHWSESDNSKIRQLVWKMQKLLPVVISAGVGAGVIIHVLPHLTGPTSTKSTPLLVILAVFFAEDVVWCAGYNIWSQFSFSPFSF